MVTEGYGEVLTCPGLALRDRVLCIVAMLEVHDVSRQLYSHLSGARNAGAAAAAVERALAVAAAFTDGRARERAQATWQRLRERHPQPPHMARGEERAGC